MTAFGEGGGERGCRFELDEVFSRRAGMRGLVGIREEVGDVAGPGGEVGVVGVGGRAGVGALDKVS